MVGVADDMKGQIPAGFIVLNAGVNRPPAEIEGEVVKLVREEIGPVAAFKTVMTVKRLPKTRSGKILRGTMRQIADGEAWKMPATIDDPAILDEITGVMSERGMVKGRRCLKPEVARCLGHQPVDLSLDVGGAPHVFQEVDRSGRHRVC